MTLDTHEIAWAAGLFDGEGWIGLAKPLAARPAPGRSAPRCKHYQQVRIVITQNSPLVLERFQRAFGRGRIGVRNPTVSNPNPWNQYYVGKWQGVQFIVACMWKFLSPIKREQARVALAQVKDNWAKYDKLPHAATNRNKKCL